MKLLVLADIHGDLTHRSLIDPVVTDCGGIVLAGDITDFGGAKQAQAIIAALSAYGKPLLAVAGNCDLPGVEDELQKNHISLQGGSIDCCGLQFVGVGGALPSPGITAEDDFRRLLEQSVSGLDGKDNLVLVSHQPARDIRLDLRQSGRHTGSRAVREFIEQYQPILAISGHIHEARGVDHLDATTLVNPGPFRYGQFSVAEINDKQVQIRLYP